MKGILLGFLVLGTVSAESRHVDLMQELLNIGAMERRTVLVFPLRQQGAKLQVKFTSKLEGEGVRVAVYESESGAQVAGTAYEISGVLRTPLESGREYRVEIENLRQRLGYALVDTEATLIFGDRTAAAPESQARQLDPRRRRFTILSSLTLFALIITYAAVQLGPPLRERWRGGR